jgi:hypothetical protein
MQDKSNRSDHLVPSENSGSDIYRIVRKKKGSDIASRTHIARPAPTAQRRIELLSSESRNYQFLGENVVLA